jgi:hypothetical protein
MENRFDPDIERYLRQQMPPGERHLFEQRLAADPELVAETSAFEAMLDYDDRKLSSQIYTDAEQLLSAPAPALLPRWAMAAAAFLVAALVAWFFWPGADSATQTPASTPVQKDSLIYAAHYDRLRLSGSLSGGAADNWQEAARDSAYGFYQIKKYEQALAITPRLYDQPSFKDEARLLAGVSLLESGRAGEAIAQLSQVSAEAKPRQIFHQALLYQALAEIRNHQASQAATTLRKITADADPDVREQATELLKALEK